MPSYSKRRGRRRVRAAIMVDGKVKTKWYPDDSKDSYRAAATWERENKEKLKKELSQEVMLNPTTSCPTLHKWLTEYLNYVQPRVAKKTYSEKRGAAKRLLAFLGQDTLVEDFKPGMAADFLSEQMNSRSPNAANKDRKNLAVAWEWGKKFLDHFPVEQGNVFALVDRFPENRSPRYVPILEDFWKVLEVAKGQDRVMLIMLLHLGLRRNEAFALRWGEDIDFANSKIRVGTRKNRDGSMEYDWLPMTKELKKELLWWWEKRPMQRTTHVFTQIYNSPSRWHEPGKPFKSRQHFMKEMCALAGVKKFGFHAIRHLCATVLYREGCNLSTIQRVLRHKSPSTTERYLKRLGLEELHIDESMFSPKKKEGKLIALNQ